jgi:ankyrin repeat protein
MPKQTPSVLLEQAFAPARLNKSNTTEQLKTIYQNQEPYYADDAAGTVIETIVAANDGPRFSEEDIEKIKQFNEQFEKLIITLASMQTKYKLTHRHCINLAIFNQRIQARNFYARQSGMFYSAIKHELEGIVTALMTVNPVTIRESTPIIHDLIEDIVNCGPGVFGHLKISNNLLNNEYNIETWLAQLRETLVKQYANAHIVAKKISLNNTIHVYNVFYIYACEQKWNPLGFESQSNLNELHRGLARVADTDLDAFKESFFENYNPSTIMTCISENLHAAFSKKIADGNTLTPGGIKFQDLEEFNEFFSALPLVSSKGIFDAVFTAAELDEKTELPVSHLTFIFAHYRYQLKSLAALKLSLTRFYLKPTTERLFQGFYEDIDEQSSYGVVPNNPELCYLYYPESDSYLPLSQSQPAINLHVFQYNKIPLTQKPFEMYVNHNQPSFKECILENIDLSPLENTGRLEFDDATLINVKVTPIQFFILFFQQCNKYLSNLIIDETATPTLQDIINEPGYFKSFRSQKHSVNLLFSFAAYTLDNFDFIQDLINHGIKRGELDAQSLTPIQAARSKNHWKTVSAIAKNTSALFNTQDKYRFGDPLLHCLERADVNIAKDLLGAGARASDTWYSLPSKNTSLHWAAEHNAIDLIEHIALADANLAALNSDNHTPIEVAAAGEYWEIVVKLATLFVEPEPDKYHYGIVILYAAKSNQLPAVKVLIAAKATATWSHKGTKYTALHWAVENNNAEMVVAFVVSNASLLARTSHGFTALKLACARKHWACVLAFANNIRSENNVNDQFDTGGALLAATIDNQTEVAIALLATGPKLNDFLMDEQLDSTLHWAVKHNNTLLVIALLQAGASITGVNIHHQTARDFAVSFGFQDCVDIFDNDLVARKIFATLTLATPEGFAEATTLLSNNFKFRVKSNFKTIEDGNTCLHTASLHNHSELIPLLITAGVSPAELNSAGSTAIQIAAMLDYVLAVRAFVSTTPDVTGSFGYGQAMVIMYHKKHYELAESLATCQPQTQVNVALPTTLDTCLHMCCERSIADDILKYIRFGADPCLVNHENLTPMEVLLRKRNWDCIAVFVESITAEQNFQDKAKLSHALIVAVKHNRTEIALSLIAKNANVHRTSINGMFCLHFAVKNKNRILIQALIFAGANVHAHNADDETPLEMADAQDNLIRTMNRFRIFNRSTVEPIAPLIRQTLALKFTQDQADLQTPARQPMRAPGRTG